MKEMQSGIERIGFGPWLLVGFALAMGVAAAFLYWYQRTPKSAEAVIDGNVRVRVEVAHSPQTRERGLSGHAPLAQDEGMFFVFPVADRYAFWMKDMLFPIDILWINGTELVDITTDVPAPASLDAPLPTYRPVAPADRVLEVPAGFAKTHGLRLGMTVELRY